MKDIERVVRRSERQLGLITRLQLTELGISRGRRRSLVGCGYLVPVGRQTFRVLGSPADAHQMTLAACLDTGGVASHRTAAWLHGLDGFDPPSKGNAPEVAVTRRSFDYAVDVAHLHTSTRLPAEFVQRIGAIPTLNVARTLFSLASLVPGELSLDVVRGAVEEAVRDGKASDPWLCWMLERVRCRGRNGVSSFETILEERARGDVTESWLERALLRVLRDAGLPLPVCQARVERRGSFAARVDFLYADALVVIEVSGNRWHRDPAQQQIDLRRRRDLTLTGHLVLEYTYDDVVRHPQRVVSEVREALAMRRAA